MFGDKVHEAEPSAILETISQPDGPGEKKNIVRIEYSNWATRKDGTLKNWAIPTLTTHADK